MNQAMPDGDLEIQEQQLNQAIEELRGVLKEERAASTSTAAPIIEEPAFRSSSVIMNIPVDVQIVLGSAEMQVSDLMTLQRGSIVALDRRIGEAVDVTVNGRRIARGEIMVMENDPSRFGIRLTEIAQAAKQA